MRAPRSLRALWLAGLFGCNGPVLQAGTYLRELDGSEPSDAEASDARVAANDAGRSRDAQQTDARFPWNPDSRDCTGPRQCFDNFPDVLCHPRWGVCVECVDDRDCASGRCNEELGRCKEPDKPRP